MATTSTTTGPVKYTDYVPLGNAIAEAFETLRANWLELRSRGQAPGTLEEYVEAHGPQALNAELRDTLSRAPAYIHDRARTRAQALIVGASHDRRQGAQILSHKMARRYARLITGVPDASMTNAHRRKLSPAEVRFIRRECRPGRGSLTSVHALALLFGVSEGAIYQIIQRRTYRDVPDNVPPEEEA